MPRADLSYQPAQDGPGPSCLFQCQRSPRDPCTGPGCHPGCPAGPVTFGHDLSRRSRHTDSGRRDHVQ